MPKLIFMVVFTAIFFVVCPRIYAQQPIPADTSKFLDKYKPATYVSLAGEVNLTTFGAAVSFPVVWIENRLKLIPAVGVFWKDFAEDGFDFNPAVGGKLLYYFRKQLSGRSQINSFYLGLGGMGTANNLFGRDIEERSFSGLIAGHTFALNRTVQIAPELELGVDEDGVIHPAIGVVFHFGH